MDEWLRWVGGLVAALIMALVGALWTMLGIRMGKLESAMKDKADKSEVDRQRDNISKIFDKIEDVRKDMSENHSTLLRAILESKK